MVPKFRAMKYHGTKISCYEISWYCNRDNQRQSILFVCVCVLGNYITLKPQAPALPIDSPIYCPVFTIPIVCVLYLVRLCLSLSSSAMLLPRIVSGESQELEFTLHWRSHRDTETRQDSRETGARRTHGALRSYGCRKRTP